MRAPDPSPDAADARIREGLLYAFSAYLLWGVSPLYWNLFQAAPLEIIAHRGVWACLTLAPFVWFRKADIAHVFASGWRLGSAALAAVLIAVNWLVFIWAVQNGAVLEASLGYFIGPLVSVALGVALLGERLRRPQAVAIGLAAIGVAVPLVVAGRVPLIALALAVSFSLYAYVRKRADVDGAAGLFLETAILFPLALGYVAWLEWTGAGRFIEASFQPVLLVLSGTVMTAGILLLFILGTRRLRLSTVGLIQFLAPSMQFGIGLLQGEPFPPERAVAFAFIWSGIAIFVWDVVRADRAAKRARMRPV